MNPGNTRLLERLLADGLITLEAQEAALNLIARTGERVEEVILDTGAADPTDPSVDDDELPVVDVAELAEIPACRAAGRGRLSRRSWLCRADDPNGDPSREETVEERLARAVRIRTLSIHDHPYRNAL